MKAIRYIFFIFFQIIVFAAISQQQNIKFQYLGTAQGLSQSNVVCILQDKQGFMWFGTRDGLNKYDGYKFTIYKNVAGDKNSISHNYIQAITEGKNGILWIATWGGGLNRFDRQKNQFTAFKHDRRNNSSLSSDFTNAVLEDHRGNVWVGTEDGGLNKLDIAKNQFVRYAPNSKNDNSLSDVFVRSIFQDSQENIWIATANGGLNLFNSKNNMFTRFQHNAKDNKSIGSNRIYTLFEDSKRRFWIGTNGGGLDLLNRSTGEFSHFKHNAADKNSLANNFVHAINEDNRNNLWIGTENGGLSILDPSLKSFQTYVNDEYDATSLSNNSIYSIFNDSKGNMWVGTFSAGVNLVSRDMSSFIHFKHQPSKNSLSHNKVLCIYEDSRKNIWIGTDGGGVNQFDPATGRFTNLRHETGNKNTIGGDYVLSICEDAKGNLWFGTWADGLTVFNPARNSFRHFKNDPDNLSSLSNDNAWTIFEDKEKNIWIGTFGGGMDLFNPDKNSFTHYQYDANNKKTISSNKIHSIYQDGGGKLWVSTDGGGLNLFDKKTQEFSRFFHDADKNSISGNSVNNIFEDGNKNLWIGTMTGLNYLDTKTNIFTNYTMLNGLPSNVIFGILQDDKKIFWISTNKGICRFDPVTKKFKNFGTADGLQSAEFKQQAYCKASSGTMYFGGNNGFNKFSPAEITEDHFEPPLFLTDFQIFNKKVPIALDSNDPSPLEKDISVTEAISLSYKNSVISFEFASLNYTSIEKKQYAYMLEGFDKGWNEVGTQRTATYTNLDPGKYVFRVKGLNGDGKWSAKITSVRVTILPPFWQTWWFRVSVVLFILGCLIAFYRIRLRAITTQKAILEKQVKDRTDEVVLQKEEMLKSMDELLIAQEQMRIKEEETIKVQKALAESNTRFSYAAKATSDAIWDRKYSDKDINWGEGFRTLFGYDINSQTKSVKFWESKVHSEDIERVCQTILECRNNPLVNAWTCEYRFLKADDRYAFVREKAVILRDEAGQPATTIGAVQDISDLRQSEITLKELNDSLAREKYFLDSLMDNLPDAIYFKDRDSKFLRVSKYMSDNYGKSENMIGKSDFEIHNDTHARVAFADEQQIQKTGIPKIDFLEKTKLADGTERWVSTTKMPLLDARGEIIGTFGMSKDVTKAKTLEKERLEALVDKAVAQGKFEIASDVMHDIGNAVVGFGSYLTRIRRLQNEENPDTLKNLAGFFEKQRGAVASALGATKADALIKMFNSMALSQKTSQEEINDSIIEQLNIITNIQEILNIQRQYISGHESQERKPVNLRTVVNDSLSMLFASLDKMSIAVSLNLDSDLPIMKGDRTRLMQALLNVLRNSIEAIDINAKEKNISLNAYTNAGKLILQVKDNGEGFDKLTGNQLFGKGYTTKSTGSGFGLYNCRAIVESHEGTIQIASEGRGKGAVTTMEFKL